MASEIIVAQMHFDGTIDSQRFLYQDGWATVREIRKFITPYSTTKLATGLINDTADRELLSNKYMYTWNKPQVYPFDNEEAFFEYVNNNRNFGCDLMGIVMWRNDKWYLLKFISLRLICSLLSEESFNKIGSSYHIRTLYKCLISHPYDTHAATRLDSQNDLVDLDDLASKREELATLIFGQQRKLEKLKSISLQPYYGEVFLIPDENEYLDQVKKIYGSDIVPFYIPLFEEV